jgi:hypothetical protein
MAFDPDAYLAKKAAFDPDAYLGDEQVDPHLGVGPKEIAPPSVLAALGRGGLKGATFGGADEIGGAGEAASTAVGDWVYEALHPSDPKSSSIGERYVARRDAYRARDKAAEDAHPTAAGVGQVGGGLLTGITTAPALPFKAAAAAGGLGKAAANVGNAGVGAGTYRFLSSEAPPVEALKEGAQGVEEGARIGGALQAALSVGAPAAQKVADKTRDWASLHWFKQLGAGAPEIRRAGGKETAAGVGRQLRDMRVVGPFTSPGGALEKITEKQAALDPEFNAILPQLDDRLAAQGRAGDPAVSFDLRKVATEAKDEFIAPNADRWPENRDAAKAIVDDLTFVGDRVQYPQGTMDLSRAHELRSSLGQNAKFGAADPQKGSYNALRRQLYGTWNKELNPKVEAAATAVGTPEEATKWIDLNKAFGALAQGEQAAFSGAVRQAGGPTTLGGSIAGASALGRGDVPGAVKAAGILQALKSYGQGGLALGADAMASGLQAVPKAAMGSVPVTHDDALAYLKRLSQGPVDPAVQEALRRALAAQEGER